MVSMTFLENTVRGRTLAKQMVDEEIMAKGVIIYFGSN